jgi:hypothetical protein
MIYDADGHLIPAISSSEAILVKTEARTLSMMISSNNSQEQTIATLIIWAYFSEGIQPSILDRSYFPDEFLEILRSNDWHVGVSLKSNKQEGSIEKKFAKLKKPDIKQGQRKDFSKQLSRIDILKAVSMYRPVTVQLTTAALSSEGILTSIAYFLMHCEENIRFLAAKVISVEIRCNDFKLLNYNSVLF